MAVGKNNSGNIVADDFQQKLLDQAKDNLLRQQQVGDRGFLGGGASYINQAEARVNRLLPLTGALQTDSTPTNMQASNMSLIAENLNEKEIEEEIELKKQTKFGDAMARIGGGITLSEEQRKGLSSTAREKYNQERLSARNKGIAEMLFVLSDALAGRDVAGRAMARAQARLPKEKSAREKINEELLRVYRALEKVGGDPKKLPAYEKAIYDVRIANQTGYGFPLGFGNNLSSSGNSLPIITTQEEYDALAPGTRYIEEDGQEYTKPETT
tara:strand:- start:1863 stop:2672 length:810 start_codon:yes stop_codon:yes gene_type:complete